MYVSIYYWWLQFGQLVFCSCLLQKSTSMVCILQIFDLRSSRGFHVTQFSFELKQDESTDHHIRCHLLLNLVLDSNKTNQQTIILSDVTQTMLLNSTWTIQQTNRLHMPKFIKSSHILCTHYFKGTWRTNLQTVKKEFRLLKIYF